MVKLKQLITTKTLTMNKIKFFEMLGLAVLIGAVLVSCQKLDRPKLGQYPVDTNPPGGPLKFYTAFDGTTVDSIRANFATDNPLSFTTGITGQAIQGQRPKALKYPSANDFWKSTSFTISWWMKHSPHAGGAEFLFSLPSKDYWHNSALFLLIEDQNQSTTSLAAIKLAVQDQWFEFVGANRMPGNILNGQWHHLVITYDEATSKLTYYVDGSKLDNLPANLTDVKNGANPRGPLSFNNVSNFIIGGWGKHVGIDGPTDAWVQAYSGALDQFRLYNKALTASEVLALFNTKR
jgi:hypothetical protein